MDTICTTSAQSAWRLVRLVMETQISVTRFDSAQPKVPLEMPQKKFSTSFLKSHTTSVLREKRPQEPIILASLQHEHILHKKIVNCCKSRDKNYVKAYHEGLVYMKNAGVKCRKETAVAVNTSRKLADQNGRPAVSQNTVTEVDLFA